MRYITQFNEFVFQRAVEDESSTAFRDDVIEYTYTHGGYSPGKDFVGVGRIPVTITLDPNELPCEARPFYRDFFIGQLKPGKLWAVQNHVLLWTHAKVLNVTPVSHPRKTVFDVEFVSLDGVWHKADLQKTFLKPWDACMFMECHDFKEIHPCEPLGNDCCACGENHPVGCNCCECQKLTKDMALCYSLEYLKDFDPCSVKFQAVYSCDGADKFFEHIGQKVCGECGLIAGTFYSNTDLPTTGVTIRIPGKVKNPYIEINGNGNQIKGEFKDLVVHSDGSVTQGCIDCVLDVDSWVVPEGNEYGWIVNQGYNRLLIENCCGAVCAWVDVDAITV